MTGLLNYKGGTLPIFRDATANNCCRIYAHTCKQAMRFVGLHLRNDLIIVQHRAPQARKEPQKKWWCTSTSEWYTGSKYVPHHPGGKPYHPGGKLHHPGGKHYHPGGNIPHPLGWNLRGDFLSTVRKAVPTPSDALIHIQKYLDELFSERPPVRPLFVSCSPIGPLWYASQGGHGLSCFS